MKKMISFCVGAFALTSMPAICNAQVDTKWEIHDRNRPVPAVIDPGTTGSQDTAGRPPSDAVVLFDGKDLSQWVQKKDGSPAKWKVENGYFEVVPKTGDLQTRESFGDCQLHVEFREPDPPKGEDQDRGNSGVFLHGLYETQVLDSYQNKTYADGQASAIYGQYPPLVNASRPPGQWQTYDIIFHGPRFDASGKLTRPARETVFYNGVLVQDNVELTGPTGHHVRPPYKPSPDKLPLALQDHNHPVRYRNIWIRELKNERIREQATGGGCENAPLSASLLPLGNARKPTPADFLHICRVARIFSKEALLNYGSEHEQFEIPAPPIGT